MSNFYHYNQITSHFKYCRLKAVSRSSSKPQLLWAELKWHLRLLQVHYRTWYIIVSSGGSRISPRWGRQLSRGGGGAPTYDFAKFSQKLHEIETIWNPRGRGARPSPPLDPPLVSLAGTLNNLASKIVNFSFKISSFSSSWLPWSVYLQNVRHLTRWWTQCVQLDVRTDLTWCEVLVSVQRVTAMVRMKNNSIALILKNRFLKW